MSNLYAMEQFKVMFQKSINAVKENDYDLLEYILDTHKVNLSAYDNMIFYLALNKSNIECMILIVNHGSLTLEYDVITDLILDHIKSLDNHNVTDETLMLIEFLLYNKNLKILSPSKFIYYLFTNMRGIAHNKFLNFIKLIINKNLTDYSFNIYKSFKMYWTSDESADMLHLFVSKVDDVDLYYIKECKKVGIDYKKYVKIEDKTCDLK